MKTISNNFLILLCLLIGASAIRFFFDQNTYIVNILSFINIVSLLYVFYLILEQSSKHFVFLVDNNEQFGVHIKNKKKVSFKKRTNKMRLILLLIGILYSLKFANSIINDIIGMVALFLSIQSDYIAESIGVYFYKRK